jgi:Flp pilus assembly protein TadG
MTSGSSAPEQRAPAQRARAAEQQVNMAGSDVATRVRRRTWRGRDASRGQVLVIFVGALTTLLLLCAVVIDVSWYWANTLRVQRAADAAALAGVVSLPGDVKTAGQLAVQAAGQNGYTLTNSCATGSMMPSSVPGMCAQPDAVNNRQLDVTLSAPVGTFFMRLIGINSITATRTAKATYELPVPMGSPLAYYGVYQLCSVETTIGDPATSTCTPEPDATTGTLASQGFFGAIEGEGNNTSTGDAYAPYYNNSTCGSSCGNNQSYKATGYDYTVVVPAGASENVYVFDPTFCATAVKDGNNNTLGHAGAGDHWLGPNNPTSVSTYYQLWDEKGFPLDPTQWTKVADSGSLFVNENNIDQSATYGSSTVTNYADQGTPSGYTNCAAGKIVAQGNNPGTGQTAYSGGYWHNRWWPLGAVTGGTKGDTYFVRVMTTDPNSQSNNLGQSFENMFSLEVTPGGGQIYGGGRMETYANIDSGAQTFYLAQISQTLGAGKTMEIDLFDPGDVKSDAWLQILSPDGSTANNYAPFTFTADSVATGPRSSGGTVNCIETYRPSGGGTLPTGCTSYVSPTSTGVLYNNSWVKIYVNIPGTYGQSGLHPPGDPAGQDGWWKIKYTVASANDTTTWMVSVLGNPVHLVVP